MPPRKRPSGNKLRPDVRAAAVHLVLIIAFGAVWAWHLTPAANKQEVAKKHGWFWQYYTFLGFSLQLAQFAFALLADLLRKAPLVRWSDNFSCATLPMVVFITAFYYTLLLSGNIVDSDDVPVWVSPVLHTGNFFAMLADSYVSGQHRTFRTSASVLAAVINILYMAYVQYLRIINGSYTYAFLQKMPEPLGIVVSTAILVLGVETIFLAARKLRDVLRRRNAH